MRCFYSALNIFIHDGCLSSGKTWEDQPINSYRKIAPKVRNDLEKNTEWAMTGVMIFNPEYEHPGSPDPCRLQDQDKTVYCRAINEGNDKSLGDFSSRKSRILLQELTEGFHLSDLARCDEIGLRKMRGRSPFPA